MLTERERETSERGRDKMKQMRRKSELGNKILAQSVQEVQEDPFSP